MIRSEMHPGPLRRVEGQRGLLKLFSLEERARVIEEVNARPLSYGRAFL